MSEAITPARLGRLTLGTMLLGIPALLLPGVVAEASLLDPFFTDGRESLGVWLTWGLTPVAAISASVLFLAPGLFLALALGRGERLATWLPAALALSLVGVSVLGALATGLLGAPVTGLAFGVLVFGFALACAGLAWRRSASRPLPWPLGDPSARLELTLALLIPLALAALLLPKFLWESFNGDGAHAFESSRLVLRHALPFWPAGAGDIAQFPGVNSMLFAFPNGWYLRLFGEIDAAVRFPLLLYLPVLVAAILGFARSGRESSPRALLAAVWLSVLAFGLALMYSATYDPYTADVALPATQDALLMICFLGWVAALVRRQWGWLALFTFFTYTASPSGLLLIGFGLLALPLAFQPRPWGDLARAAALLLACLVVGALAPRLLVALGAAPPGGEHGLVGLLRYFAYLQITDWKRLLLILVPCGIAPAFALFLWKRQDATARLLTLISLGYFLFFFFLAHISLHHFVPVMILPVAVAARLWPGHTTRYRTAWLLTAPAAVVLSLPSSFVPRREARLVGVTLSETVGDYARSDPAVLRASSMLHALFPYDWEPSVPDSSYGGSPLAWNRYAQHGRLSSDANYALVPASQPPPAGMRLLASEQGVALYLRSDSVWRAHRSLRPPTPAGSPVYAIPRGILFHRPGPVPGGPRIIDVAATLERLGIDVTPLLARLGVRR